MRANRWVVLLVLAGLLLGAGGSGVLAAEVGQVPAVDAWRSWTRFTGLIVSRPTDNTLGLWVIGERDVQVTEITVLDETLGPAVAGAEVMVIAQRVFTARTDGPVSLEALLIRVLAPASVAGRFVVRGWVADLTPTELVVNGLTIRYDSSTQITGPLRLGALVRVVAVQTADGIQALSIEVLPRSSRLVYFEGAIQLLSRTLWVVGGRRVKITGHTIVVGQPALGLLAKVWAIPMPSPQTTARLSHELVAILIQVEDEPALIEWTGEIRRLPPNITIYPPTYVGQWLVGRRTVWVTQQTEIVGTPQVGLQAHVHAFLVPQGRLLAKKIEVLAVTPATQAP